MQTRVLLVVAVGAGEEDGGASLEASWSGKGLDATASSWSIAESGEGSN